jgi:hypothetical protein
MGMFEKGMFVFLVFHFCFKIVVALNDWYFYIYELPERVIDTWPSKTFNNSKPWVIYRPAYRLNNGAGELLDSHLGIFGTWQFSLFRLVFNRLVAHPQRTRDPSKASVFFVPYDGGIDSTVSSWDGRNIKNRCPRSGLVSSFLQKDLIAQQYFPRHSGRDHFVVFSTIQGVSSLGSPGCRRLYRTVCRYCTKLTIEISYHAETSESGEKALLLRKSLRSKRRKKNDAFSFDPTWVSVPYPSSWHFYDPAAICPWKIRERSGVQTLREPAPSRPILVAFVGGAHTQNKQSNALRRILKRQCLSPSPSSSSFPKGVPPSTAVPPGACHWLSTGGKSRQAPLGLRDMLDLFQRSSFCLQPPGDSPTRKGIFDSILAGCIPVVFNTRTLEDQYPWHIGGSKLHNLSIFVDPARLFAGESILPILQAIPEAKRQAMRAAIAEFGSMLQYAVPPLSIDIGGEHASHSALKMVNISSPIPTWQPPEKDAVDVLLQGVFERARKNSSILAV